METKYYKSKDGEFYWRILNIGKVIKVTKVTNYGWIFGIEIKIWQCDPLADEELTEITETEFLNKLTFVNLKIMNQ